jgi:hypothetical protein
MWEDTLITPRGGLGIEMQITNDYRRVSSESSNAIDFHIFNRDSLHATCSAFSVFPFDSLIAFK